MWLLFWNILCNIDVEYMQLQRPQTRQLWGYLNDIIIKQFV